MKKKPTPSVSKSGSYPEETATPPAATQPEEAAAEKPKRDANFKQSRDVPEDRGTRQMKTGSAPRTQHGK